MFRFLDAADADERMDELERFVEFWYGPRRPEFEDAGAGGVYSLLPAPLRRFYAFAGRWPSPDPQGDDQFFYTGKGGHHLFPPDRVVLTADGRLKFFMEYQGAWEGLTLPGEADPPVWISGRWDDPEEGEGTRRVSGALSGFLVTHCLMATTYESDNSPRPRTHSDVIDRALARWFEQDRAAAERLWEAEPGGCPDYRGPFYLFHGHILVHVQERGRYKFGALHPEGVELLREVLGGDA
jgi:hypothetical protein